MSRQAQRTFTFINLADDFMQNNNLHSTTQAFAHSNKSCSSSLRPIGQPDVHIIHII